MNRADLISGSFGRCPGSRHGLRSLFRLVLGLPFISLLAAGFAVALPPEGRPASPWVSLSLEPLGFYGIGRPFLEAGSSMLTVHFVDSGHVLVTHSLRTLVPRRGADLGDAEDGRLVGADLIALPSGKVLAHTEWRTADHGRYLWNLGRGRFLLRIGHDLSMLTPLAKLQTGEPFAPLRFPARGGMPVAALLSPDASMLTIETLVRQPPRKRLVLGPTVQVREEERQGKEVVLDFFRLSGDGSEADPLHLAPAGNVLAPEPIALPLDGDGYLWVGQNRRGQWPVTFHEFGGNAQVLGPILSSCVPRLQLVSRSEFLAFACGTSEDRVKVQSFGFDGHENWEESLPPTSAAMSFAFAPEAGRFAMSRIVDAFAPITPDNTAMPASSVQELRVYQTESGDLLLKIQANPALRGGENFDLSADGHRFAVVRGARLEVYELPRASSRDLKDLADARQFAPPLGSGPVQLGALAHPVNAPGEASAETARPSAAPAQSSQAGVAPSASSSTPTPQTPAEAPASPASRAPATTAGAPANAGDTEGERRHPPTLLNPGEKAEAGTAKPKP